MDLLSNFSSRSFASLDHIARLSGFPGKLGEEGSKVWNQFLEGKEIEVKAYCETDVVNTYLVYLKYLKLTGKTQNRQDMVEQCGKSHPTNIGTSCQNRLGSVAHNW